MFSLFQKKGDKVKFPKVPKFDETDPLSKYKKDDFIVMNSGLHSAFRSSKPIDNRADLIGREATLDRVLAFLRQEGLHVLLFGDRGVGKSSIGNVILRIFETMRDGENIFTYRCNPESTLADIVREILKQMRGIDVNEISESSRHLKGAHQYKSGSIGLSKELTMGLVSAGVKIGSENSTENEKTASHLSSRELAMDPSWVANEIHKVRGLLFVDELDKVADPTVKSDLATLVKAVSDYNDSEFNFVLAGIGQNAAELTAGHPSVQRCLKEVEVKRLDEEDLIKIVSEGEKKIRTWDNNRRKWLPIRFDQDAKSRIAHLSHGYPYFTQLIAMNAAEIAIKTGKQTINIWKAEEAIGVSVNDAEEDLKKSLKHALKDDTSPMFRRILKVAASISATAISAKEIKSEIIAQSDEDLTDAQLNRYFGKRLVRDETDYDEILADTESPKPIFLRLGSGKYRFFDPRMPSYIRLVLSPATDDSVTGLIS